MTRIMLLLIIRVCYCGYYHPLGVVIRRTGFGFEDSPKNYGEKEVSYMQTRASYTYVEH